MDILSKPKDSTDEHIVRFVPIGSGALVARGINASTVSFWSIRNVTNWSQLNADVMHSSHILTIIPGEAAIRII